MARRPLKKSEQSRSKCMTVKASDGKGVTLCVEGRRYGFTAYLKSRRPEGGVLPVPTGRARTLESAIKNAKRFLARVGRKRG